jgi:hypothetical protein
VTLLGRLSIVGAAAPPAGTPLDALLSRSRVERTFAVVCRNLGIPCPMERSILARQLLARAQAEEIQGRMEAIPLKGLFLAHHLYPSPGLRDMGDLDLLIRRPARRQADAELRRLGYVPEFDPERVDGGTLNAVEYWRDGSLPVHLHWHVSNASLPHFMYRIDVDEIWRDARGGVLAPHHLLVTLCEHALKHSFAELIHLTDIELVSRGVDWPLAAETARRWGLEQAVHFALVLLRDLSEVESPGLDRFRATRLDWAGRAFLALARRRRRNGISALGFLSMTRRKLRFIRETLAPPRTEGLRTRTLMGRLRGALRAITS